MYVLDGELLDVLHCAREGDSDVDDDRLGDLEDDEVAQAAAHGQHDVGGLHHGEAGDGASGAVQPLEAVRPPALPVHYFYFFICL